MPAGVFPGGGSGGGGGGPTGLLVVHHDDTLAGDGTTAVPVGVSPAELAKIDAVHDAHRERVSWTLTLAQYTGFANGPIGAARQISRSPNGEVNLSYGAFSPNPLIWRAGSDSWRVVSVSQLQAGESAGTVEIAFGAPFGTRTIQASGPTAFASQNLWIEVGGAYRIPGSDQVVTYTVTVPDGGSTRDLTVTAAELRALTASVRAQSSTPSGHAHVLGTVAGVEYRIGRTADGGLLLAVNTASAPVSYTMAISSDDAPPTAEAAELPDGWDWQIGDLVLRKRDADERYFAHSVAGGETTESLRVLVWDSVAPGTLVVGDTTLRALGDQPVPAASHKGAFTPSLDQVVATDAQQLSLAAVGDLPEGLTLESNAVTVRAQAAGVILSVSSTFDVEAYQSAAESAGGARAYPKIYWTVRKAGEDADTAIKHASVEAYIRAAANSTGTELGPDSMDIHVGFSDIFNEGDVLKVWGYHPWVSPVLDNRVQQLKVLAANSGIVVTYSSVAGIGTARSLVPAAPAKDGGLIGSIAGIWGTAAFEDTGNVTFVYNGARRRFSGHVTFPKEARHLDTVLDETIAGAAHGNDTSVLLNEDFTTGKTTFRFWRIYYSADDEALTVNIGTLANPVPNPAGVLLRDFLLSVTDETTSSEQIFHLREAAFEPDDSAGSTHEWEFHNVTAMPAGRSYRIQLYEPITSVNYLPTPTLAEAGFVPTVNVGGTGYLLQHPYAATIAAFDKTEADIGHDLKALVLEEAEPKGGMATYEADIQQWGSDSVQIAPAFSGHFELGVPGGSGSMPGRWTLELGGGAGTTAAAVWGQEITSFRLRFSSDGTNFGDWAVYAVERDPTISNALAYRTTDSDLTTPTEWANPSDGDVESFEFDFVLADGNNAYPTQGKIDQKALSPSDLKTWLGIPDTYLKGAIVAGQTLTITLSDDTTVVLNAALSPAGTGITLAQVRTLLAAIVGGVDFTVAGQTVTATIAAASVGAGNLDVDTALKRAAIRTAIGAGTSNVGNAEIDARIIVEARAGNTDPFSLEKVGIRKMTAAEYAALAADQRTGIIFTAG